MKISFIKYPTGFRTVQLYDTGDVIGGLSTQDGIQLFHERQELYNLIRACRDQVDDELKNCIDCALKTPF